MKFNLTDFDRSRRDFIKNVSMGFLGACLPWQLTHALPYRDLSLGRVTFDGIPLYEAADFSSKRIKRLYKNQVYAITQTIRSNDPSHHNKIWYMLDDIGYAHSAYIQEVKHNPQHDYIEIPESGRVGEITVPVVQSYYNIKRMNRANKLNYAMMFWVKAVEVDESGICWYKLMDDQNYSTYYIPTRAMRIVPYEELQPVSPMVEPAEKWILVDIKNQRMDAYEGDQLVRSSKTATGMYDSTPRGWFTITRKRPCRHMEGEGFDLPGVPWVSYIAGSGIAFHGVYWHNDLGIPHSHGCIHLPVKLAQWVYLWTVPHVPVDKYIFADDNGTRVQII